MGMSLIGIKSQENDPLIHPLPFALIHIHFPMLDRDETHQKDSIAHYYQVIPLVFLYNTGLFMRVWEEFIHNKTSCFWSRWLTTALLLLQGRLVGWRTLYFGGPSDLGRRCRDNDRRAVLNHSQSGFFHNFLWPFQGSGKGPVFVQLPLGRTFWLIARRMETKLASIFQSGQGQNPDEDKQIRNISQKKWCYMCL